MIKNKELQRILQKHGKDDDETWLSIMEDDGSVRNLDFLTPHEKAVFETFEETDPMWIIEHAAARQKYVCQAQSINIKVPEDITLEEMSDIHVGAWAKGIKSLYYCRGKAAGKAQAGTGGERPLNAVPVRQKIEYDVDECKACHG
jgi:ribonucleoside-diphosphate reductase alpha chain